MDEHVRERDGALAMRGELGPDVRDALAVAELAAFDEQVRDRARDPLPRRRGKEQCARVDRGAGARIGYAGNRVYDDAAPVQDCYLDPCLGARGN